MRALSFACVLSSCIGVSVAGCAEVETADERPPIREDAGSTGSGGTAGGSAGQGGGAGAGGSSNTGGTTGTGGATTGTGGRGGASGSGGAAGSAGQPGSGGAPRLDAGPPGRVFFDDFEDGNATTPSWIDGDSTLGAVWSVATREAGNHVFAQSAPVSDWVIAVSGDYRWTDQVVEATVKLTSATGMIGIFGRIVDMKNYYFLYLDGSNVILRKRVASSSANLVKIKFPAVSGSSHTLKLSIIGTTLTGYVDGMMLVTASDAFLTSGGIGVGTSDGATGDFDDVIVSR